MKSVIAGLLFLVAPFAYAQKSAHVPPQFLDPTGATLLDIVPLSTGPSATLAAHPPLAPVSVSDLRIPSKAIKEWQRAEKAYKSGHIPESNAHLQKAVEIYPDFFVAHFDLGANHLRSREYEQALSEYEKAASINPNVSIAPHGASVALFLLKRYPEAEALSRRVLEMDPNDAEYRFVLAQAILAQGRFTPEAEKLLHQSEASFPNASLILAQVFLNQGKIDSVVAELQQYLLAPDPQNKTAAECTIALLNGVATGSCAANKTFPSFQ